MRDHLTEAEVEDLLRGQAPPDVVSHLDACEQCAKALGQAAGADHALWQARQAARHCPVCQHVGAIADVHRCSECGAALRAGRFRTVKMLVKSERGRMYLAEDETGASIALKELVFGTGVDADGLTAFHREASLLRKLNHPAIPKFIDAFEEGEGSQMRLYLAQEYVPGESLLARLETKHFAEADAEDIARQVLDILIYLQDLSPPVFHRDIKPANLIVRPSGAIAVVDFGAARDLGATAGGTAVGTFGYMPTEQHAGMVSSTTDVYALGATLIHLLTRRAPWEANADAASKALNVSEPMRRFLAKATASDVEDRFADARAARNALARLGDQAATARPVIPRWLRSLGVVGAATAAAYTGLDLALATPDVRWLPGARTPDWTGLDHTFVLFAGLGTLLLAARLVLQAIGGGGDGDGHGHGGDSGPELGGGGDAHHGGHFGIDILTLQGAAAFSLMFGLVGLAVARTSSVGGILSLIFGTASGLVSVWGMSKLFVGAMRLESSGTLSMQAALGQRATVYLTIPASGRGKVHVTMQGRLMELEAVAAREQELPTGAEVRVVMIRDQNVLVVEPVEPGLPRQQK